MARFQERFKQALDKNLGKGLPSIVMAEPQINHIQQKVSWASMKGLGPDIDYKKIS